MLEVSAENKSHASIVWQCNKINTELRKRGYDLFLTNKGFIVRDIGSDFGFQCETIEQLKTFNYGLIASEKRVTFKYDKTKSVVENIENLNNSESEK